MSTNSYLLITLIVLITLTTTEAKYRIINGSETSIENHPWQVSLQFLGVHFCAGSILDERQILTAAHCINELIVSGYQIVCGVTNLTQKEDHVYRVDDYIIHDDFDDETYDYDIAVITLSENLTFSSSIQPIGLPEDDHEVPAGIPVLASGWGITDPEGNKISDVLREVQLTTVEWEECKNKLSSYGTVTQRMLCAGGGRNRNDTCQADSGGALELGSTLIGIISWGASCGKIGVPGVYTNVGFFRNWIREKTGI